MKIKIILVFILGFYMNISRAQTVTVSDEGKQIQFVITSKSSRSAIADAARIFEANGVNAIIKAKGRSGHLRKISIKISSGKGDVSYTTSDKTILQKGVRIVVNKIGEKPSPGVGPYTG
jgi:hypothetical protein